MLAEQIRLFVLAVRTDAGARVAAPAFAPDAAGPDFTDRCLRYLPLAGLLTGLIACLAYLFMALLLPHPIAIVIALVAAAWAGSATHERQWAQFCEAALAPRRQSFDHPAPHARESGGAITGLVLLVLLKFETLAQIESNWSAIAFLCAHPASRACAVLALAILPPSPRLDESGLNSAPRSVRRADGFIALLLGFAPVVVAAWAFDQHEAFVLAILLPLTATVWLCRKLHRRWQGHRDDTLGATQQLTEVLFYIGLLCWLMLEQMTLQNTES